MRPDERCRLRNLLIARLSALLQVEMEMETLESF